MLIEVKDKIVSTQIFDRKFVCDLNACKGACCIEGNSGAPLTLDEIDLLEDNIEKIIPFMRPEGIDEVESNGVFYMDEDNEAVTTLVNGGECSFVYFDENNITKCSIEQAYNSGKIDFNKPISCHLYPIREKQFNEFRALTYDVWPICAPACACGEKLDVPVYRFLKGPIIRAYGEDFYSELKLIDKELKKK
ncbi:MAG: hypothetical protein RI883_1572 [Bacteroidota bacterium]|jgi:hypothetical protein